MVAQIKANNTHYKRIFLLYFYYIYELRDSHIVIHLLHCLYIYILIIENENNNTDNMKYNKQDSNINKCFSYIVTYVLFIKIKIFYY